MRRLLNEGRVDAVLALVSAEDVGSAWCRYAARAVEAAEHPDWDRDPDGWAAELYFEPAFLADEELRRTFLRTIADTATDEVLGWVGAGPLEDFVTDDDDRLRWIEQQAADSERFRRALANVWIRGDVSPESLRRLETAAGVQLK